MNDKSILIAEDNPDDETLILRALRKSNVANEIVVVRDGAEALDRLFGEGLYEGGGMFKPAVVLLDLKVPKIDGLEVLRRLRADDRHTRSSHLRKKIKVLLGRLLGFVADEPVGRVDVRHRRNTRARSRVDRSGDRAAHEPINLPPWPR